MIKTAAASKKGQKASFVSRVGMTVLTVVLIVLFFFIMMLVSRIQGTARVVNYAGLVRGETQRIIKLEGAGLPQDGMIEDVASFIAGLRYGSDELDLVCLNDDAFQIKMEELDNYFTGLKAEILLVRQKGYQNTAIIEMSEEFFMICDEATGLAEEYSQHMASELNQLERIVVVDILGLVILIALELVKALRYAAVNRVLQSKVYLDEATGLPNKNKCEELLDRTEPLEKVEQTAVCVFDLNNLRTINNTLGHDKGDEYIRNFAVELRKSIPAEYFVGRDGGDEFVAILHGLNHTGVRSCLQDIRAYMKEYSRQHPEMPLSYAVGYALSTDYDACTMRELFRGADKNMYVDKNRAKMEEAAAEKSLQYRMLDAIKQQGFEFEDCLYCDAMLDKYRVLRAGPDLFLAQDGSYSGAVEQIAQELGDANDHKALWAPLQLPELVKQLNSENTKLEWPCRRQTAQGVQYGRITAMHVDTAPNGLLHHFIMGFEFFRESGDAQLNEKQQLTQYYEQLKQSIIENSSYVDALLDTAQAVYSVDLTNDRLEKSFYRTGQREFDIDEVLPCSYQEYCRKHSKFVTEDALENYRIVDSAAKLLQRFGAGARQVTVEFREAGLDGKIRWLQKTVLLSREAVYDSKTQTESSVVRGIILFKNTTEFHEKEQKENERLQAAFREADTASKAKTQFLNRMSHDIRTPINGIMGMVDIIRKNRCDSARVDDCLDKISLSASHLLALVNDVLDMSKLDSGHEELEQVPFDLEQLMREVAALVDAQLVETGLIHNKHRKNMQHTVLVGSPIHLRRIMLNLLSNAIKYNKPGGRIDTYAEELSCDGNTAMYEFRIVDTGIGMSPEFVQNQLFHPFTQEKNDARTRYKGTGLGMSIVKELIEKMGGQITVESVQGQGTTFTFTLTFRLNQKVQSADKPVKAAVKGRELEGMHVLLAEDNEINMEIAEFYLTDHGAKVEKAWNGQQAVCRFKASGNHSLDAILMDVMMPVMDGITAAHKIRMLDRPDAKAVPIIATTAQSETECRQQCADAGMNGYLTKPLDAHATVRTLLQCVNHIQQE